MGANFLINIEEMERENYGRIEAADFVGRGRP